MKYRFLGRTGVRVSELALGTMSFGAEADEHASAEMFNRAVDAGVNFFDCANAYAGGRSEEILGRLIASSRDNVVLATKAYFPVGPGVNDRGTTRYHLVRAVEASLRRLNTDRIDVFYLHRFDEATDLQETLRAIEHLVSAGKILYPAVSNFAAWQTMKALGLARAWGWQPIVAMQPMYNLVKRQAEVELLPMAQSEGLGVVPYSPLGGGLLTGKYGTQRRPESGRLIDNPMYAVRYAAPSVFESAEQLCARAAALNTHPATLAVGWVLSHPAVTSVLLGARNAHQLEPALATIDNPMSDELYTELSKLTPTPPPATDRNEETSQHNYGKR